MILVRRRFWWRRKHLISSYAMVAAGASGLVLLGGWVLLMTLAHMIGHH